MFIPAPCRRHGALLVALLVAMACLIYPAAPARAQGEALELRLRLNAGETYHTRMTNRQRITHTVDDQPMHTDQQMTFGYRNQVLEVSEGVATVKATYETVQIEQRSPMGQVRFDSAAAQEQPDSPETAPLRALVGATFTYRVSPAGKVLEVTGVDEIRQKMIEHLPAQGRGATELLLRQQFGNEAMRQMLEMGMAVYPDKPVAVGDSWSRSLKVPGMFPLIVDATWTFKGRDNGVAMLGVESTVKEDRDAPPLNMGHVQVQFRGFQGTQSGSLRLDEASGWPLHSELKQRFAGTMDVLGPDPETPAMSMPMTIEGTTTIEGSKQ